MAEGSDPQFINVRTNQRMSIPAGISATDATLMAAALAPFLGNYITDVTLNYTVGTGGDFATLNEAIEEASHFYPAYATGTPIEVNISLLTGYIETEGVFIRDIDLSYITITSIDATVTANVSGNLFDVENGGMPNLECIFDMGGAGGHGIHCAQAKVTVGDGGGVVNAGTNGINSIATNWLTVLDGDFSGAQGYGAYVNHGSFAEIGDSDFSSAGQAGGLSPETNQPYNGIYVRHSSRVNLAGACNLRLSPGSDSEDDLRVEFGGQCDHDITYIGGQFQPSNVLSPDGIIFQSDAELGSSIVGSASFPAANEVVINDIPKWTRRLSIKIEGASINTATRQPIIELSIDNGSSWIVAGYVNNIRVEIGGVGTFDDRIFTNMITAGDDVAAARSWFIYATLFGINEGEYPHASYVTNNDDSSAIVHNGNSFYTDDFSRVDAIRIRVNGTGNFDGGTYEVIAIQ